MYGPICIFFIYYPISILNCILYSHSPIILSTLCKYIKPAIPVDYCRKSGYVRQKEVFSSRSREVQRKERFLHLITEKNVYFALCHTLYHYGPLWIIFPYTMYISYILQHYFLIVFYLQRFSPFLHSSLPAFLVFQVLFSSLCLYIVVLHPFITTLLW